MTRPVRGWDPRPSLWFRVWPYLAAVLLQGKGSRGFICDVCILKAMHALICKLTEDA